MKRQDVERLAWVRELLATGQARTLREQAHLSRLELALAVTGVTESAVARWERGDRTPRTDAALRYARVLERLAAPAGTPAA